jgi:Holliday junction resolvase RusA-like endonuclease
MSKTKINIKPLSVNEAWQGKRFKTPRYKKYERDVLFLLPKMILPKGPLAIELEFGFSTQNADWDNPIKPFVDILQKKYRFNDSRIYQATVTKKIVKKGAEYTTFKILPYAD